MSEVGFEHLDRLFMTFRIFMAESNLKNLMKGDLFLIKS